MGKYSFMTKLLFTAVMLLLLSSCASLDLSPKYEVSRPDFMKPYDFPENTKFYKNHIWVVGKDIYAVKLHESFTFKGLILSEGTVLTKIPEKNIWAIVSQKPVIVEGKEIPPKTAICVDENGKTSVPKDSEGCARI